MVLIDKNTKPSVYNTFEADLEVLTHSTTIKIGY